MRVTENYKAWFNEIKGSLNKWKYTPFVKSEFLIL